MNIIYTFENVENINGQRVSTEVEASMSEFDWDNGGSTNSLLTFVRTTH